MSRWGIVTRVDPWTPEEDATLARLLAVGLNDTAIGEAVGRTRAAVERRRLKRGLLRVITPLVETVCARCHQGVYTRDGGLRYCLECGHEPAESAKCPVGVPSEEAK